MRLRILLVSALLAWGLAEAREVGRFEGPQGKLVLFDDRHKCPEGSAVIAYFDAKSTVPGCWFEKYGFVWAMFSDGDKGVYAKDDFKWLDI